LIVAYHAELAGMFRDLMPLCTTAPTIDVDIGADNKKSERPELLLMS